MMSSYSAELAGQVRSILEEHEMKFHEDENSGVFRLAIGLNKAGFRSCDVIINVEAHHIGFYSCLPIMVEEAVRAKAAEYLIRANCGMRLGSFEMDIRGGNGDIRFKVHLLLCDDYVPSSTFLTCFVVGPAMIEQYTKGLTQVLYTDISPEEAIRSAESDEAALAALGRLISIADEMQIDSDSGDDAAEHVQKAVEELFSGKETLIPTQPKKTRSRSR